MGLKSLFKIKERPEEKELAKTTTVDIEPLDIPKIVFEDLELQVTIGQWLGVLPVQREYVNSCFKIYTHLSAEELMKHTNISTQSLVNITQKTGELFKKAGVDSTETCVLSQYDKDKFSFHCHFENTNEEVDMNLRWGSMADGMPEFNIAYKNAKKKYYYCKAYDKSPMRLRLADYTLTNVENGNELWRFLSPYSSPMVLRNGDYKFSIDISRPKSIEVDPLSDLDYVYRLRNEEEVEQYLLGLSFPFAIDEVYKKMCELLLDPVSEYPNLSLKAEKKIDDKSSVTTDLISLNNGQLNNFVITRNGRTISLDDQDNWSFRTPELSVRQNNEGKIDYSLHSLPKDMLDSVISPFEQVKAVHQEVEQVRQLAKTMLKK